MAATRFGADSVSEGWMCVLTCIRLGGHVHRAWCSATTARIAPVPMSWTPADVSIREQHSMRIFSSLTRFGMVTACYTAALSMIMWLETILVQRTPNSQAVLLFDRFAEHAHKNWVQRTPSSYSCMCVHMLFCHLCCCRARLTKCK